MRHSRWKLTSVLVLFYLIFAVNVALADFSYVVQPGDTLLKISRRFNTTIYALMIVNDIANPNLIYVGQTLVIPDGSSQPAPTNPPPVNPPPNGPLPTAVSPPAAGTTYVVQPGDTLYRIGIRHGVSVQAIALANNIQNTNFIYVGQVLTIPSASSPPIVPTQPPVFPTQAPPVLPTQPPPVLPTQPLPTQPPPPLPTAVPPPNAGQNMLANGSFEEGWYHPSGIPELQIPGSWVFEWDEGPTGYGSNSWDVWVRPEVRVLPSNQLPSHERPLFIFDGNQTVKVFKGSGAISYRVYQDVTLEPGTYRLEIAAFPDLVMDYVNGQKVWADDPLAGEVRFIVGNGGSGWILPVFGQKNVMAHTFTVDSPQTVRIGVAIRGRFALMNNGWFLDDWSLVRLQ